MLFVTFFWCSVIKYLHEGNYFYKKYLFLLYISSNRSETFSCVAVELLLIDGCTLSRLFFWIPMKSNLFIPSLLSIHFGRIQTERNTLFPPFFTLSALTCRSVPFRIAAPIRSSASVDRRRRPQPHLPAAIATVLRIHFSECTRHSFHFPRILVADKSDARFLRTSSALCRRPSEEPCSGPRGKWSRAGRK